MNLFSISQLSQYAGIKPHTIRVWEQRYNALKPARSEGNTRYYDGEQLRRLLNIVSMMDADYKVSELCSMPDEKLSGLILNKKHTAEAEAFEYFVSQLISAGMSYDEALFEEFFEQCLLKNGLVQTYKKVVYPMLDRIGLMWSGSVIPSAQEHFISNIVRQKILRSIDSLPPAEPSSEKWLLFLPEDEFHEIGLLYAGFLIRQNGNKVVYLGSSISTTSVFDAIHDTKPEYLLLFLVHYNHPENVGEYLNELTQKFHGKKICVAGNYKLLSQVDYTGGLHWLDTIDSLQNLLTTEQER